MALTYLSGDDIGRGRASQRRQKRRPPPPPPPEVDEMEDDILSDDIGKAKKKRKPKKSKAEKKAGRKRVKKKIAKVALAPARAAFLTAVRLNLLKLSTKLVRVWKKPNGKEMITKFWDGFGGDINKLKAAIIKGSKQQISADSLGVVATTVIATATPIIVALVPIIKSFKAAGSPKEAAEFNEGVDQGKKDLRDDPEIEKGSASMPKNKDAGIVTDEHGDAKQDDKETKKNRKESDSGGNDGDNGAPAAKGSGGGGGGGGDDENKSDAEKKADAEKKMSSNFSPLGLFFMTLIYLMMYAPQNNLFFEFIATYCFVGMCLIPLALSTNKNRLQKIAYFISFTPINLINNFNLKIKSVWELKTR